jgi:cell cycle sensor histidine kinase DivJ
VTQHHDPLSDGPDPAIQPWHGLWVLVCVAAVGTVVLIGGRAPGGVLGAFAGLAAAGALGGLLHGQTRLVMALWAAAALWAVGATGGITGPGAAWALLPAAAGAALGRSGRERLIYAAAVALLAAAAQAAAVTASPGEGLSVGLTGLAAVGTTAWALISAERLATGRARQAAAPVFDQREAERAQALAVELQEARAEADRLRSELDAGGARTAEADAALAEARMGVEAAEARIAATEAEGGEVRAELEQMRLSLERAEAGREQAETANQAKSRFLATMSHELRTPLNAVMGFADIMRNRLFGPLPDRYAEYSQLIHESGAHLLDLINDVLDLSKIEADRYRLERERFDAREAIETVLKLMRPQAEEAGIALRAELPTRALPVEADKRALKQIALNLLGNAFKFTPSGGEVRLSLAESGEMLELVVADTGIGIAPEDLERLGRPYEQAGDADTRSMGTGLGLSLVRAFSGLHDGTMSLESTLGEGTAATVRLPVLAPETELFDEPGPTAQVLPFVRQ